MHSFPPLIFFPYTLTKSKDSGPQALFLWIHSSIRLNSNTAQQSQVNLLVCFHATRTQTHTDAHRRTHTHFASLNEWILDSLGAWALAVGEKGREASEQTAQTGATGAGAGDSEGAEEAKWRHVSVWPQGSLDRQSIKLHQDCKFSSYTLMETSHLSALKCVDIRTQNPFYYYYYYLCIILLWLRSIFYLWRCVPPSG